MSIWNQITVLSIDDVYFVPSIRDHNLNIHNRQSFGLSFCYQGKISYHWQGEKYVSDHGCAILLPKGESYFLKREESGMFPVINFSCSAETPLTPFERVTLRNPQSYLRLCEHMRELWITEKSPAKIMSLFYEILAQLSEEESHEVDKDPGKKRHIVRRAEPRCDKAQKCHEIPAVQRFRKHEKRPGHDPDEALGDAP